MNLYRIREWLRYRRESLGRHGMHSPFVYRLVDEALKPRLRRIPMPGYRNTAGRSMELPDGDGGLLRRIIYHTQVREIQLADSNGRLLEDQLYIRDHGMSDNPDPGLIRFRRLFLFQAQEGPLDPDRWPQLVETVREELQDDDLVAAPGIFTSAVHNAAWQQLCRTLPQRVCIDFFRLGLLLFREEFQVPQTFRVKFPL